MVRRMKIEAVAGRVVRGRRRGLLLFALLLVVAQVLLFIFLRTRRQDDPRRAQPSIESRTAQQASAPAKTPDTPPAPTRTAVASAPPGAAGPENQPLAKTDIQTPPAEEPAAPSAGADQRDDGDTEESKPESAKARRERERAERERERREKIQAEREREREREQARERVRLESERDRARLEAEKDRARLETERAEKARLEAERERARLEEERHRLQAERSTAAHENEAALTARPGGSPDVLVVVVSAGAGSGSVSREVIRNIYFGKTTFWPNNTPVKAYGRPAGSAAGRRFYRSILGMSSSAFQAHWNELQLSGGGIAPSIVSSADSVLARVAGSSGAIGYVLESELPADVSGVRLVRFK
jgi:hypothetical protein